MGHFFKAAEHFVSSVGNFIKDAAGLVTNMIKFNIKFTVDTFKFATGQKSWKEYRKDVSMAATEAIAVLAIIYGGPLGIAAGITVLDATFNKGRMLGDVLDMVDAIFDLASPILKALGLNNVYELSQSLFDRQGEYRVLVEMTIQMIAMVVATMYAMGPIQEFAMLALPSTVTMLFEDGKIGAQLISIYGYAKTAFDVYTSYENYVAMEAYWKDYLANLRNLLDSANKAKRTIDEQTMASFTTGDYYRFFAGNPQYNIQFAGSYQYKAMTPNDPMVKIANTSQGFVDREIEDIIHTRNFDYSAGSKMYINTLLPLDYLNTYKR
jgi:hypothetical protein